MADSCAWLETPRCPKCGYHLLINQQTDAIWCSHIYCDYGIRTLARLVHGVCEELDLREVRLR